MDFDLCLLVGGSFGDAQTAKRPSTSIDCTNAELRSPAAKHNKTENEIKIDEHLNAIRLVCEKNPKMAQYLKDSFYAMLSVFELQEINTKVLESEMFQKENECKRRIATMTENVEKLLEESRETREDVRKF